MDAGPAIDAPGQAASTRRVLVLGGSGGFGARIATRLASDGWEVVVAGRSLERARAACGGRPGLTPAALDRSGDLGPALAAWRPFALVDAAGPFQGSPYGVPRACVAAGCHYLDIADGAAFVSGIAVLDRPAREAGVALVSGASSVPALSGAVCRALSEGLDEVRSVEMAISASSRAAAGSSVTRAILSYLGRPVRLWRGGRREVGYGWQEMRRQGFVVAGANPIRPRLVGLAEAPDLDLFPDRLPGRPAVSFRAGTELAAGNLALLALSWLVRLGAIADAGRLAPALIGLQRPTARLGGDRSGMIVRMFGRIGERPVERRWTLVAERGDGPEIPALAVPILLRKLAAGGIGPGARDAGALLGLDDFGAAFAGLAIRHGTETLGLRPTLYRRVMGAAFERLSPALRSLHEVLRDSSADGRATALRGRGRLARLLADAVGLPTEGEHDLHVGFAERGGVETWTRAFGRYRFRSRLSERRGLLVERVGPFRFGFALPVEEGGLSMRLRRYWIGPIRIPLALAPRIAAREWEEEGRFRFHVRVELLLIGLLIEYQGWLAPPARVHGTGRLLSACPPEAEPAISGAVRSDTEPDSVAAA